MFAMMTRDHILSEIRRTADQNSGHPLGVQRFFAETGIRESDWRGKYWVRWGDALREAGFRSNDFNKAIPDDELLDDLAALVRELGHFPLQAELSMKARSDPNFPSRNVFRRLGGKQVLAAKLQKHLIDHGEKELAELCGKVAAPLKQDIPESELAQQSDLGYVYLIKSGRYYKIGRTNALGRRERDLAIQLPDPAKVIHSIKSDDPIGIEEYWHRRFRDRRKNGEWFELTSMDIAAFRRRKFM